MKKTNDERINDTMRLITEKGWETYFPGHLPTTVKSAIDLELQNNWPNEKKNKLGELLSLGGIRIIKTNAKTEQRQQIRLTLLMYRVLGEQTDHETLRLRDVLLKLSSTNMLKRAKCEISHALRYINNLKLWADDTAGKYAGSLKHYYVQDNDARQDVVDFTSMGWCFGMVIEWLSCKAHMTDFWAMHSSDEGPRKYRYNMASQGVRPSTNHMDDRYSFRLRVLGLERTNNSVELEVPGEPSLERLASDIIACRGTHCTISLNFTDDSGHAVGACFGNAGTYFMDPNLGEFWFTNRSFFEKWFPIFSRKMNYRLEQYFIGDYSVRP